MKESRLRWNRGCGGARRSIAGAAGTAVLRKDGPIGSSPICAPVNPGGPLSGFARRWRGSRDCSRCGADLAPLMTLAAQSWRLREAARTALGAGQFERAFGLVAKAQATHRTPVGEALRLVVLS